MQSSGAASRPKRLRHSAPSDCSECLSNVGWRNQFPPSIRPQVRTEIRRAWTIGLAFLVAGALAVPTAQAATRYYDFQDIGHPGHTTISVTVIYKNKHRHGAFTPRLVFYDAATQISCNPPVGVAAANSLGGGASGDIPIKLRKRSFNYSFTYVSPPSPPNTPPQSGSGIATGKVVKKKRVDGSVSILDYTNPSLNLHNCTSGGPVPYSATPCRPPFNLPPYIKKSLPNCVPDI